MGIPINLRSMKQHPVRWILENLGLDHAGPRLTAAGHPRLTPPEPFNLRLAPPELGTRWRPCFPFSTAFSADPWLYVRHAVAIKSSFLPFVGLVYQPVLPSSPSSRPIILQCRFKRIGLGEHGGALRGQIAAKVPAGLLGSAAQWYRKMCLLSPHRACPSCSIQGCLARMAAQFQLRAVEQAPYREATGPEGLRTPTHVGHSFRPALLRSRPHSACLLHHSLLPLQVGRQSKFARLSFPVVVWLVASNQCRPLHGSPRPPVASGCRLIPASRFPW
jgi:hypothetical protein